MSCFSHQGVGWGGGERGGQVFCLQFWDIEWERPGKKKTPNNSGGGASKICTGKTLNYHSLPLHKLWLFPQKYQMNQDK